MDKVPSIKELHEKYQKHNAKGLILRSCDFLAVYPAKVLLYFPLTPNQITILWIFIKIIAAFFVMTGEYLTSVIAILIFQSASIIDGSDGIVARVRKHYSLNGTYIDIFGHYFCNSLILISIAIGIFRQTGNVWYFVPAGIAVFTFLLAKSMAINSMWFKNKDEQERINRIIYSENLSLKNEKSKLMTFIFDLLLMDNPFNIMFWGLLFGYPEVVLWIYAVLLFLEMCRKLFLQFWRIYKEEKASRNQPKL